MRRFFDPRQARHAPALELHNGGFAPYAETPARTAATLAAIDGTEPPADRGTGPILAVHTADYVDFLRSAPARWAAAGRPGDAIPYAFPVVRRRAVSLDRIDAAMGRYSFDATTPITAQAWTSSYWSAQSALAATHAVLAGDRAAFALCRPPGHHAGADYCGGYCHLNTAAIAAQAARDAGVDRVAILDIDYHHGNGTQDIFWMRGDVFYASVHADPATDYPFYWGHADETGEGAGHAARRSTCRCRMARRCRPSGLRRRRRWMPSPRSRPGCSWSASARTHGCTIRSVISRWRRRITPSSHRISPRAAGRPSS